MLVLTRNKGQRVLVGDDITVVVLDVANGQAKLGIEAPEDTPVHREEVAERIKAQGEVRLKSIEHALRSARDAIQRQIALCGGFDLEVCEAFEEMLADEHDKLSDRIVTVMNELELAESEVE